VEMRMKEKCINVEREREKKREKKRVLFLLCP
jgi:hypothetical protein